MNDTQKIAAVIASENPTPVPIGNGVLPKWVFALEVDLTIKGGGKDISIDFSGGDLWDSGSPQNTKSILKEIANGNKKYFKNLSHMSDKRMSAHLKDYDICFIFYLCKKIDWEYSASQTPISLNDGDYYNKYVRDSYRVDKNGDNIPPKKIALGCRTAYVVVNGAGCYTHKSDDSFPFNLLVDLMYTSASGVPRKLPIVIDPEIQWPGGTRP